VTRPDRDLYDVLGISRQASAREISRAYRSGARASHPDRHPDDPAAAEQFKDLTAAYEILGDSDRRAAYDRDSRVVRVAVSRRTRYVPPPVRLGARRPPTGRFDLGAGMPGFEAWPRLWSGQFEAHFGGQHVGSATHFEDEVLHLALERLRRLRISRF
jgi:curved DNA-binding protein CbpA